MTRLRVSGANIFLKGKSGDDRGGTSEIQELEQPNYVTHVQVRYPTGSESHTIGSATEWVVAMDLKDSVHIINPMSRALSSVVVVAENGV